MAIIKMNVDTFREILHSEFNKAIELSQFPPCMKTVDVIAVYKKCSLLVKCNYRPETICPICQRYLKDACITTVTIF